MPIRHNSTGARLSLRRIGLPVGPSTRPKFLVLSNGLRDQLGHYYETSVSVAEAAERAGFQPILGTHADCPLGLLPPGLAGHALFRTDHWMWNNPTVSNHRNPDRASVTL